LSRRRRKGQIYAKGTVTQGKEIAGRERRVMRERNSEGSGRKRLAREGFKLGGVNAEERRTGSLRGENEASGGGVEGKILGGKGHWNSVRVQNGIVGVIPRLSDS